MKGKGYIFKFEKSYNISYNEKYICCLGEYANLYSATTGEHVKIIKEIHNPNYSQFLSEDKLILKTTIGMYFIYDLKQGIIVGEITPPLEVLGSNTNFAITPDEKFIIDFAYVSMEYKLMLIEIKTGEKFLYELGASRRCELFYNDAKTEFYIATKKAPISETSSFCPMEFYFLKYSSETVDISKIDIGRFGYFSTLAFIKGKIAMAKRDVSGGVLFSKSNVVIYDIYSQTEQSFGFENNGTIHSMKFSTDGKYLAIAESNKISVFDVQNKELIKSFDVDFGCFVDFFNDDTKLLVGTWENGYLFELTGQGMVNSTEKVRF